jgi:hypothetical protein
MTRWKVACILGLGASLAACQAGPGKTSEQSKNAELERRVSELERRAATPSPMPLETAPQLQPTEPAAPAAAAPAPAPHARAAAPRASRSTTRRTAHPAPARPAESRPSTERVDVIRSVPPAEAGRGAETGDPGPRRERTIEEPRVEPIDVPAGTQLNLVLESALSSATSRPGQQVTARIERATSADGRVVLPGGSLLKGRVTDAEGAGRVSGRARLAVSFDHIVVRGRSYPIATTAIDVRAPKGTKRDAEIIGGGTAAGAVLGAIVGGGKGAKKGAIIGATAGTGAVLVTKGEELEVPAGSRWAVTTRGATRID